jgi:aspartate beta-hydroxylase
MGYLRKTIGKIARNYARLHQAKPILKVIGENPELRNLHEGFYHQFPLSLEISPIESFHKLFLRQSRFRHRAQRPRFYLPALQARPWWPRDAHSMKLVENRDVIVKEFNDIRSRVKDHPQGYLIDDGDWTIFPLFRNQRKFENNCRLCPGTTKTIESLPLCNKVVGLAYFSVMAPGTRIKPHCGPVNTRIRYHLTLAHDEGAWMRVDTERRSWAPGECLVFDDSFEHEVQHHGRAPRAVLVVDCWHPGLSALEREWVERLYAQITRQEESRLDT